MRFPGSSAWFLAPALAILASIQLARAEVPPFRSLNDLPRNWSGEAGDLFNRVAASLRLGKALEKGRVGDDRSYRAEYEVKGTLTVGGRTFRINGAQVWVSEMSSNSAEVIWMLEGDTLIRNLRTIVRHRGEQRDYELVDHRGDGGSAERRFVLRAPEGERR
jgi:hypothetical protein